MSHKYYLSLWKDPNFKNYMDFYCSRNDSSNYLPYIKDIQPGEIASQTTTEKIYVILDEEQPSIEMVVSFDLTFEFSYENGFTKLEYANLRSEKEMPLDFYATIHYGLSFEYESDMENLLFNQLDLFPHLWNNLHKILHNLQDEK